MTETGSGVVYDGVPLDDVEVAIAHFDDDGDDGEILLRAPMLMRCYRDGTTGRVTGPDGTPTWFATGDAGHLTEDGTLSVVGRIADMITTGGENVWPDEVERVLSTHPNVAEVAVWKRPDPEWGERVVAWVVATADIPHVEELKSLVATTIAPWAAPKEIVFTQELPRTPSGKVLRRALS
jgi:O-succinylbenzoic acid--CoA ligase